MGMVESRQNAQMHLVKQAVNKGVNRREPPERICGSVVQREVLVCMEMRGESVHVPIPPSSKSIVTNVPSTYC